MPSHRYADRMRDDDPDLGEELADEIARPDDDEADVDDEDWNAHTLSIRRADGEEVVTIVSHVEEWSVYLKAGGGVTNAFLGTPGDPSVWVNAIDRQVERDEDGTYFIRID
jgi:hypothetical protein